MTVEEIKNYFCAMPIDKKAYVLALLGHNITVRARGFYPGHAGEKEGLRMLCSLNEIQHSITDHLTNILARDDKRYPDNIFIDIIFEKAQERECEEDLIAAFNLMLLTVSK